MHRLLQYCGCSVHYEIYPEYSVQRGTSLWLERGALPMSLLAVRFRIPLGAGFSEKYQGSPLSI